MHFIFPPPELIFVFYTFLQLQGGLFASSSAMLRLTCQDHLGFRMYGIKKANRKYAYKWRMVVSTFLSSVNAV